jgi:predicted dehydrogenase
MTTIPLRWGLLATADINESVIGPIRNSRRSQLVAVSGRDPDDTKAYAREKNIPRALPSYQAMIDDPEIDVIYNPLPNTMHAEWTAKALEAGKHVLCEKPMVVNMEQFEQVESTALRTGKMVFEAVKYMHHPQTWKVIDLLRSGELGALQHMQGWLQFYLPPEDKGNIRLNPDLGGGAHWDIGVYPMTWTIAVNGGKAPREVLAQQMVGESGVDVAMAAQLNFANNVTAQISCSFRSPWREGMYLTFEDAFVNIPVPFRAGEDKQESQFTIERRGAQGANQQETVTVAAKDPFQGEIERIEGCILDGLQPIVPLSLSREFLKTTLAIYESARTGKSVSIA